MIGRRQFLAGCGGVAATALALPGAPRAQGAAPIAVRGAYSAPGFTFNPLFVANSVDLWKKDGLALDLKLVQGGPLAMVALTNGEVDFVCVASTDPMISWDRGIKTLIVAAFTGSLSTQFSARKDWMAKLGISPASPLEQKVKALKGAGLGSSSVGGGPTQYAKYLASMYRLDPERDLKIVVVGFGPSRIAALREDQVDVTVGDAPEADEIEADGFGQLFLAPAQEVPLFKEFPYTVLAVTPELAAREPETVRRIARTVGRANDLIHSDLPAVLDVLKLQYPKIDPQILARAMKRDIDTYPPGGRMSAAMWKNGIKVAAALKTVRNVPPAAEGEFWTNKFL